MQLGGQAARLSAALGDRYPIERELGSGGMATVYLARDLRHERDVALKVLRPELTAILGAERFLNEIRITAQLDHPHILTLIDSGVTESLLWYVIPYVRGESLRDRLTREKQLGLAEAVKIARQVAGALDYAHGRGVIHRDIKPDNILFHEGEAVLADFGIALAVKEAGGPRLTETGLSLGTPQYMSPEQATGDRQLDARSDIYSLGAVVYEMVAGEPPHTGATVQAIVAKLITERPTRLTVIRDTTPERLDAAVAKALAKVPADRWQTAAEFGTALGEAMTTQAQASRLSWRPWVLGGIAAVVLAAVGWWVTRGGGPTGARVAPDQVQITFTGNVRYPAISPDGTRLAYVGSDCDDDGCTSWLGIEDLKGGGRLRSLRGSPDLQVVHWGGDSRFVTVSSGQASTVVVSTLGGETRTVAAEGRFGEPIPGTDTVVVGAGRSDYDRVLFVNAVDGRVVDSLPASGLGPVYPAPGGRLLLVTGGTATSVNRLVDRAGRVTDSLVFQVPGTRMGNMRWLPNAAGLLAALPRDGDREWDLIRYQVDAVGRIASQADTVLQRLPLIPQWGWFDVTADARLLIYGSTSSETAILALDRRDPTSTRFAARRLGTATTDAGAAIDSAGRLVAFTGRVAGADRSGWQLFVMPFDSGQAVAVSPVLDQAPSFGWQPGTERLVYTRLSADRERAELYQVDPVSRAETAIGSVTGTDVRIWPLPGGGVAAVAGEGGGYLRVQVLSRPGQRDTAFSLPSRYSLDVVTPVTPSPDGQSLAVAVANPYTALVRMSLRDGSTTEILRDAKMRSGRGFLRWSGRSIEYGMLEGWGTGSWWRVDANGGSAQRLGKIPYLSRSNALGTPISFSHDGRRAVVVQTIDRSDAFMIKNLDQLLRR